VKSSFSIIKHSLLTVLLALLLLPLIQSSFTLVNLHPLNGNVTYPSDIPFSIDKWSKAEFQEQKEIYLNSMFGFRTLFVKLNNQIAYSVFGKAKANGVIIGKSGYLYEESYLNAYYGNDFLGKDSIISTISRLKFLSDTLNKLNKHLLIVFAPGKATYYPEFFPDNYKKSNVDATNYKIFSKLGKENCLNIIDFNSWFLENKYKSKYPLYPKHGIHWSKYGMAIAADSINKKIENLVGYDIPNVSYKELEIQPSNGDDNDIGNGMNLLFNLKEINMAYPKVVIEQGDAKANILVVSDSYYWGIYNYGISKCFNTSHFWYYNKQIYPESATQELLTDNINTGDELLKHDVIVIMATEANLKNFGWGFVENAYSYFKHPKTIEILKAISIEKINEWKDYIKKDKKWMAVIKESSLRKNISVDSALTIDARWQAEQQNK
jgi:hypothetical protein